MNDADTVILTATDWFDCGWGAGCLRPGDTPSDTVTRIRREYGKLEAWQEQQIRRGHTAGATDFRDYLDDQARKGPHCPHCGSPLTAGGMAEHACVEDQVYPL